MISIDENDVIHWHCLTCGAEQAAPISHEAVETPLGAPDHVALPPCTACAALGVYSRDTARVAFDDTMLAPATAYHDSTGRIVQVEIPDGSMARLQGHIESHGAGGVIRRIDGVVWHPALLPHMQVAKRLAAAGKLDPAYVCEDLPEHGHVHPGG